MKISVPLLILVFALTGFAQDSSQDAGVASLPLTKKNEIGRLLAEVYEVQAIYANSTDPKEITIAVALVVKDVRKTAESLPDGFLKKNLVAGAGAWEKSFYFRYDSPSEPRMSMSQKAEIIKVYKLENTAPEDRFSKLFDFAQAFFDIAADVAVASGVPANIQTAGLLPQEKQIETPQPLPPVPRIVSGGVVNGKATSLPKPPYPPGARKAKASGAVSVQVLIDEDGNVVAASAVSGDPLLRDAAVSAARQAKFSRTVLSGQPVKVSGTITYNFVP